MGGTGHSFFTSYRKIACQLFWNEQSRQMEAAVRFGLNAEGPLGQAHGTGWAPQLAPRRGGSEVLTFSALR